MFHVVLNCGESGMAAVGEKEDAQRDERVLDLKWQWFGDRVTRRIVDQRTHDDQRHRRERRKHGAHHRPPTV